jgi:hypothetical protein
MAERWGPIRRLEDVAEVALPYLCRRSGYSGEVVEERLKKVVAHAQRIAFWERTHKEFDRVDFGSDPDDRNPRFYEDHLFQLLVDLQDHLFSLEPLFRAADTPGGAEVSDCSAQQVFFARSESDNNSGAGPDPQPPCELNELEQQIWDLLADKPLKGYPISRAVHKSYDHTRVTLADMIKRKILRRGRKGYVRCPRR